MNIPVIKTLVDNFSLEELELVELALADEKEPEIHIEGQDAGERLTHAFAAVWILNKMNSTGQDFKTVLREYTRKLRESIS